MKGVQCYELIGGIAHKNRAFFLLKMTIIYCCSVVCVMYFSLCLFFGYLVQSLSKLVHCHVLDTFFAASLSDYCTYIALMFF